MDEAGADRALIVPPSWEGDRIDYALEACEAYPDRFGMMARIPQDKPAEGAAMLRDFAQNSLVKGVRLTFHRPIDRNWMVDGTNDGTGHWPRNSACPRWCTRRPGRPNSARSPPATRA